MKKAFLILSFIGLSTLYMTSCDSDEDTMEETPTENELGVNEVVFADDNIVCKPFSSGVSISNQGILSVIMLPCQNSSSKLDGYFKYGKRPAAGTYTVFGTAGSFPNALSIGDTYFSMVFYGHGTATLYSTGGTVELTVNADDNTKLDMKWTDITMQAAEGSPIKFSGSLIGI
jgi:hypothetical protein